MPRRVFKVIQSKGSSTTTLFTVYGFSSLYHKQSWNLPKLFHVSLSYKTFEKSRRKMVHRVSTVIPSQFSNITTFSIPIFILQHPFFSCFLAFHFLPFGNTTVRFLPQKEQIRFSRGSCIQETILSIERKRYYTNRLV